MNKALLPLSCAFLLCSSQFLGESVENHLYTPELTPENAPWFTGPLLAPSAHTIPPKHVNIEPYVFFTAVTGGFNDKWARKPLEHNFYSLLEQNFVQIGLCDFLDVQIVPQIFYQFTKGAQDVQVGDLPVILDVQLYSDRPGTRWPAIKLALRASAPVGKYDHLNPRKLGTDGAGTGSWMPTVGLAFSRLYQLPNKHFFAPRISFNYIMPLSVPIKGYSVYGGVADTAGTVYPGNIFWTDFGFEYALTRNWVFAMDLYYQHNNKTRFFGREGTFGLPLNSPSEETISIAPAVEYNFNESVGIIAGFWTTLLGHNTSVFTSGVVAVNIYL